MIAIGKYNAKVTAISFGRASTGNEQIAIQFEILDGEFAGENIAYLGTFTENSIEYTTNALRAVGWLGDDLSELPGLAADGKLSEAQIVVRHEEYEGQMRARIKFVNPPGGGRFTFKDQIEGNDLRSFSARMKSAFRGGVPAGGGSRPPAQRQSNGGGYQRGSGGYGGSQDRRDVPPPDDTDLPF